ncbi:hypothetical protein [Rossellomorea marisflavi]|uniref:hypothetical protein n=1 Tax=Rossellomorea marisflavi TaxID=189381 RepID=UPI000A4EB60B|nr:hypothetical protein [Rossellomorea marisflavi]
MKRRAPDSNGKRGKIETPEAQLRRLDSLPVESGRPQRNGTDFYILHTSFNH